MSDSILRAKCKNPLLLAFFAVQLAFESYLTQVAFPKDRFSFVIAHIFFEKN